MNLLELKKGGITFSHNISFPSNAFSPYKGFVKHSVWETETAFSIIYHLVTPKRSLRGPRSAEELTASADNNGEFICLQSSSSPWSPECLASPDGGMAC